MVYRLSGLPSLPLLRMQLLKPVSASASSSACPPSSSAHASSSAPRRLVALMPTAHGSLAASLATQVLTAHSLSSAAAVSALQQLSQLIIKQFAFYITYGLQVQHATVVDNVLSFLFFAL